MASKMSPALGFQGQYERQIHRNPSILTGDEDYLDDDEWDEQVNPRRRSSSIEALASCLTTLSSSLQDARTALTTRVKILHSGTSCNQLRNSMIEFPSSIAKCSFARANSMSDTHRSSESDLDLFGGVEVDDEDLAQDRLQKMEPPTGRSTSCRRSFSSLLSRSWMQRSKK